MAQPSRNTANGRKRTRTIKYFYLNDMLHRSLHINLGQDTITTWCYPLGKRVAYSYSEVKKHRRPAFTTAQVADMIMRRPLALKLAILEGKIQKPTQTYALDENRRPGVYYWSEDNVMEALEYFSNVHRGRPRKDGLITPQKLPTPRQLRAMMRQEEVMYIKNDDGEFVPVWKAQDFT